VKIICFLLLSTSLSAALPTHYGVGVRAGVPAGSWGGKNPYAAGNSIGVGIIDLEFGQQLISKIGYRIGLHAMSFNRGYADIFSKQQEYNPDLDAWILSPGQIVKPGDENQSGIIYGSFGINYVMSKNDIDFFAMITYGKHSTIYNKIEEKILDDSQYYIIHATEQFDQKRVFGFEVGARKKIKWGLWAEISHHYTPLDKNKVNAASIQWVGLGLKYIWKH